VADIASLGVPIDRQFPSVAAMFQAVMNSIPDRERLYRLGEGPDNLTLIMAETAFRQAKGTYRFRYVVDHAESCRIRIVVVFSWLRPLEETW
jgi:hypothetical protein